MPVEDMLFEIVNSSTFLMTYLARVDPSLLDLNVLRAFESTVPKMLLRISFPSKFLLTFWTLEVLCGI